MALPTLTVDAPPRPWTGRFDGDGPEHRRWWQAVAPYGDPVTGAPGGGVQDARKPAVLLGFCSDEGVRRNKGRTGAAAAPAALRNALGPLACHLGRSVADAGDVVVSGRALEEAQARLGSAVTGLLDAGHLTAVLGGGHETAYASYLGVSASREVQRGRRLGILNLDAHFDLRDEPVPSSGTPFLQMARAEAAAGRDFRYAVVGISEASNTRALFDTAGRLGVDYLLDEDCGAAETRDFVASFLAGIDILYLTIDLDVLPASIAPGVSAPAGFGVPLPVVSAVCRQVAARGTLVHVDVAELNPAFDVDGRTARTAARLLDSLLR
jgi:formiminoglutamase